MENFDWEKFFIMATAGTPFFNYFIRAAVQRLKDFKNIHGDQVVQGDGLYLAALIFGAVFGSLFMLVTNRPPVTNDWWEALGYAFMVIVYGLFQGFLATEDYKSQRDETEKLLARYNGLVR
jgi:hypothetical protein